jgi:predicted nucleotidyltransferase
MTIFEQLKENKFPYTNSLIHLFRGGSDLHGAQLVSRHDDDWFGIYVEPPSMVIGLRDYPHYVWSTAGDTKRNVPGDMDICLYSLRKWAKLASGGNPTCLSYLFAPNTLEFTALWDEVVKNRGLFLSKVSAEQFRGFALAQRQRYMGERGQGKHGQRPELEERFGFDTKAAMHVMRLIGEGIELMTTGRITLPRPDKNWLIAIRKGELGSLNQVKLYAEEGFKKLDAARRASRLPLDVDRPPISRLIADTYLDFYTGGLWPVPAMPVRHCIDPDCNTELSYGNSICPKCGTET